MIDHRTARIYASARQDGEIDPTLLAELQAHLDSCRTCRTFAAELAGLGAAVAALPVEAASPVLVARIVGALASEEQTTRPRRAPWRLAPALAAATAVALLVTVVGPATLPIPAAAAEALLDLETFQAERVIEEIAVEDGFERVLSETVERVWFQAPAFVRRERRTTEGNRISEELEIARPGELYIEDADGTRRSVDVPPEVALPEPLSPSVAILGSDRGPGPDVAGRPTRTYEIETGEGLRRVAVDAQRLTLLDDRIGVVLEKERFEDGRVVRKRVISVEYNRPIPAHRFAIPPGLVVSAGFNAAPARSLTIAPAVVPDGMSVVASGWSATGGEAILYARGSFRVLVRTGAASRGVETFLGDRPALYNVELYEVPSLTFPWRGRTITVVAPLPLGPLSELAAGMYPD